MNIHFLLCGSQLSILLSHNYNKDEEESSKLRVLTRTGIDLPLLYKYLTSLCQRSLSKCDENFNGPLCEGSVARAKQVLQERRAYSKQCV